MLILCLQPDEVVREVIGADTVFYAVVQSREVRGEEPLVKVVEIHRTYAISGCTTLMAIRLHQRANPRAEQRQLRIGDDIFLFVAKVHKERAASFLLTICRVFKRRRASGGWFACLVIRWGTIASARQSTGRGRQAVHAKTQMYWSDRRKRAIPSIGHRPVDRLRFAAE
ncbi:hypothetical protein SDC9_132421 [bioreactor metagenome]|uniref:Uncharacterized protein n=1 Tax=bioreactor metagenome TaxID=1076179 RepID=A0A645D8R2_9ZZZZ